MSRIYVGNLSYNTNEDKLTECFSEFGSVTEAKVIMDRETGNSRGFGFVTFEDTQSVDTAIAKMDEQELDGRRLRVAKASESKSGGGGGGGRYGGGRGGGRGGGGGHW